MDIFLQHTGAVAAVPGHSPLDQSRAAARHDGRAPLKTRVNQTFSATVSVCHRHHLRADIQLITLPSSGLAKAIHVYAISS